MSARKPARLRSGQIVTRTGNRLYVARRGTGPPLLMLNGIGGHTAMWEPLAAELGRTRELILLDAPGCGLSPALPVPRRMSGLARLVVEVLDALELPALDVLGYSWGGALAQQVARDWPDRVGRLVLASTTPGLGGQPPGPRVMYMMLTPARYRSTEEARARAGRIYGGDHRRGTLSSTALEHWDDFPPSLVSYLHQLFAISGWTSLPWLHRVTPPTLVLSGDDDPLVPILNARLLACLIARSELRIVAGGGHLWLLDHPVESSKLVEGFLAGAPPSARRLPALLPIRRPAIRRHAATD